MIFSEGVDAVAFAGEVVLTAYMPQTVTRAVINVIAEIIAILRIVLSLQELIHPYWSCLIFARARRSIARRCEMTISEKALWRCALGHKLVLAAGRGRSMAACPLHISCIHAHCHRKPFRRRRPCSVMMESLAGNL